MECDIISCTRCNECKSIQLCQTFWHVDPPYAPWSQRRVLEHIRTSNVLQPFIVNVPSFRLPELHKIKIQRHPFILQFFYILSELSLFTLSISLLNIFCGQIFPAFAHAINQLYFDNFGGGCPGGTGYWDCGLKSMSIIDGINGTCFDIWRKISAVNR